MTAATAAWLAEHEARIQFGIRPDGTRFVAVTTGLPWPASVERATWQEAVDAAMDLERDLTGWARRNR